jgi:[glutamine synthetase] adenylyltransferase / [glutamine synthetase]-adenylyl-L-tyrosine phosphorylase
MPDAMESELSRLLPDIDPRLVEEHLRRLDAGYFQRFDTRQIARHIRLLASLTPEKPVALIVEEGAGEGTVCTVLAFDYPGAFSFIAGVLSSMGFDIGSGDIFTWSTAREGTPRSLALRRRRIIDCFTGVIDRGGEPGEWEAACAAGLTGVFVGLEQGGEPAAAARRAVNEMAARSLEALRPEQERVLYPVQIDIGPAPSGRTRMRVLSQDTPFFLYTFSTALTLQEVLIEHVTIRTEGGRIEDEFEIVDSAGHPLTDPARIDRIKLSVLLTKQFTSFLGGAPDPLAALLRFEQLVKEAIAVPGQDRWLGILGTEGVMRDLAQLLGTSTFLWEDFVRLQYEELLPMLAPHMAGKSLCEPVETLPDRLAAALDGAVDTEEFARRLNDFKDREIYLYDLDHILTAGRAGEYESFATGFLLLSRRLTALAEIVVDAAAAHAWKTLCARVGEPRTVAGLPVRYALLGLGKMGGIALGYASDIEILLVYSDSGASAGPDGIENAEFFDRMVREILQLVHAKREGIFHIDLRLRPYGAAGPLGCSLESFCTYYARGGPALSYERLALVRLRAIGGDRTLGSQVERLRDEMVYSAQSIDTAELREIRARQAQEKTGPVRAPGMSLPAGPVRLNAKFSPGALVDLEYAVQILQVIHGATEPRLRTPRIHEALEALASIGVLEQPEAAELVAGYRFFRRLINGLRMLRGSAKDLELPQVESAEYLHLARRVGYVAEPGMSPAQKLHLDFETHSAAVRAFVERHFGRDSLPGTNVATVADLILSDAVTEQLASRTLADKGFNDTARAFLNLRRIAGEAERRTLFARLAILACDILSQRPDPDMALNNWERFLHVLPDPQGHLRQMLSQPMRLEILLSIFSASQFLADTLVGDPSLFDHIGRPEIIRSPRKAAAIAAELGALSADAPGRDAWCNDLRRFRRREILRIAARDICLGTPTQRITEEISDLADAVIGAALSRLGSGPGFCVIAFGKLGARELNYSSDIDLLGICSPERGESEEHAARLMEALRADLSDHTTEGYAYRVDLRLRPYGSSGQLVPSLKALADYYAGSAALWELQALLKARPVAGDLPVGKEFLDSVQGLLLAPHASAAVTATISRLRREALKNLSRSILTTTDVKTGLGGLRDVEFLVQGMQMIHAHEHPELLCGGTLAALGALGRAGLLSAVMVESLSADYVFLRRVEHFLQIYEDRQTHSLPRDPAQLRALARRMLGSGATSDHLLAALSERFQRVQSAYRDFVNGQ